MKKRGNNKSLKFPERKEKVHCVDWKLGTNYQKRKKKMISKAEKKQGLIKLRGKRGRKREGKSREKGERGGENHKKQKL